MSIRAKVGLTVAVVALAVGYTIFSTIRSGEALEYYRQVDEVQADPGAFVNLRLKLHGNVVKGSILKHAGTMDFRFALHKGGRFVEVHYTGLVPDAFKDCAELVVSGKLTGSRTFEAEAISAKCPSKYEGRLRSQGCGEHLLRRVQAHRE